MSDLVKVDLVSTEFNKSAQEAISKWLNGQISGERCAKTIVEKAGDTLPVAGVLAGMLAGGSLGLAGGPAGAALGALGGAAAGGLGGQVVNRLIKLLR